MIKFHFSYLIFLLLLGSFSAVAGDQQDTSIAAIGDTVAVAAQESVPVDDISYDSLYLPVPDSIFSSPGNIREVSAKQVSRYKNSPEYAYANDSEYWRKDTPQEPNLLFRILFSRALRWVFLILVAGLVLYGVYQLALENNFKMLIRTRKQKTINPEQGLPGEKIDFEEVIRLNQAEGNYRMAIRFLYLRLIHTLREKSGILFRDSSTNAEITGALGTHPAAENFRWLATAYEYAYYGEFVLNLEIYIIIRNRFEALQKIFSD